MRDRWKEGRQKERRGKHTVSGQKPLAKVTEVRVMLNDGAGSGRHFHPGSSSTERTSYIMWYLELKRGIWKAVIEQVQKGY